ncbi:MAG TPA: hypothetical protein PKD98_02930 [Anaerolineae bacterium]|nr:hypothetical protein [Anaerolineae bacterium]
MNEFNRKSLFTAATLSQSSQLKTLAVGDLRQPWRSVYGFPMAAARLAARQPLILHCREDEVFQKLASLNHLLAQPDVLNQAYGLLTQLQTETRQNLIRRLELEQEAISESEALKLVAELEQALAQPVPPTTVTRLETILSGPTPSHELAGLKTSLARLQGLMPALAAVKDQGFHVVAQDRRRQPAYPALEARRDELIQRDGQPTEFRAGLLLPPRYHLTLWAYLIVRSEQAQSPVWN